MERENHQGANVHDKAGMESLELLDLLLDHQDGVLFHKYSPSGSFWTTSEPSVSVQDNETIPSSLLSPADYFTNSNIWSPVASDSGISEHANSDNMNSPLQNQLTDCYSMTSNYKHVCKPNVYINIGEHAEASMLTRMLQNENNSKPQCWMTDPSLTVKDLLLSSNFDMPDFSLPHSNNNAVNCEELVLTEDEIKLLSKEGIVLSTQLPLAKYEERILKKVRRKIRNKHSAQESRKKKKEYIQGLEARVSNCMVQNQELQCKVVELEKHNRSLLEQLRKLQSLVSQLAGKATQTSTSVTVLLLSFFLVIFPTMNKLAIKENRENNDFLPVRVFSRSLHNSGFSRVFYFSYESEEDIHNVHYEDPSSQVYECELQSRSSLDMILASQAQGFTVENPLKAKNQSRLLCKVNMFNTGLQSTAELLIGSKVYSVKYQIIKQMSWNKSFDQYALLLHECLTNLV